jgi:hypothetical protein
MYIKDYITIHDLYTSVVSYHPKTSQTYGEPVAYLLLATARCRREDSEYDISPGATQNAGRHRNDLGRVRNMHKIQRTSKPDRKRLWYSDASINSADKPMLVHSSLTTNAIVYLDKVDVAKERCLVEACLVR